MMLWLFGQVHATMLHPGVRTSLIFNSQHVATVWPNACNMLCPTMLQYVLKCCDQTEAENGGLTLLQYVVLCRYRLAGA